MASRQLSILLEALVHCTIKSQSKTVLARHAVRKNALIH